MAVSLKTIGGATKLIISKKSPSSLALIFVGAVYSVVVMVNIYKDASAYFDYKKTQEQIHKLEITQKIEEGRASKISKNDMFETSFYQGNINAYAKVNHFENVNIQQSISKYLGATTLKISFSPLEREKYFKALNAFGKLGYISEASPSGTTIEVVRFTKEDALKVLAHQNNIVQKKEN